MQPELHKIFNFSEKEAKIFDEHNSYLRLKPGEELTVKYQWYEV